MTNISLIKNAIKAHIAEEKEIEKSIELRKVKALSVLVSNSKELQDEIENLGNKGFTIYVITSENEVTLGEIEKEKRKSLDFKYAFPRVNKNHVTKDNKCLYVGSSLKISSRLKQHLGFIKVHDKTTALRLNNWLRGKRINIDLYEVNSQRGMELAEDSLWEELKPLLGRVGRK